MPCPHKFRKDLYLENLTFEPTTLIVGTFNPLWPEVNKAEWFYGRTHDQYGNRNNNFWDVLPRLYGEASLVDAGPEDWKSFCERSQIAITDLIDCIEDANEDDLNHRRFMGGYADSVIANRFQKHNVTDILSLIKNHPGISNVYITNGVNGTFWMNLWNPIELHCHQRGMHVHKLLTPSKNARFSLFAHNTAHADKWFLMSDLNDYILTKWQQVWHEL